MPDTPRTSAAAHPSGLCDMCDREKPDVAMVQDEDDDNITVLLCRDCREELGSVIVTL